MFFWLIWILMPKVCRKPVWRKVLLAVSVFISMLKKCILFIL